MDGRGLGRGAGVLKSLATLWTPGARAAGGGRRRWHPLLVLAGGMLAVAAVMVRITGTGVDLFVLFVVCTVVIALERTVGDWAVDRVGPGLTSVLLAVAIGFGIWWLLGRNSRLDRFYAAAERAGYHTVFSVSPAAAAVPVRSAAGAAAPVLPDRGDSPRPGSLQGTAVGGAPVDRRQASVRSAHESARPGRSNRVRPSVRIEAPRVSVAGRRMAIHAFVSAAGEPVTGASVTFRIGNLLNDTALTNERGVAGAEFLPRRPSTYELRVTVASSERLSDSSAGALLYVIPGRY